MESDNRTSKTCKDILMICKGYFSDEFKSVEEALLSYYNKYYYAYEAKSLSYEQIINLWFRECAYEFVNPSNYRNFISEVIYKQSVEECGLLGISVNGNRKATDFYEVLYYRMKSWLNSLRIRDDNGDWIIDLSAYEKGEMFLNVI